jgi:SAM-dependent methyltransferase
MNSILAIDSRYYPQYSECWDDQLFRDVLLKHFAAASIILDLGAGSGYAKLMNCRGIVARVCGLDPDPGVLHNPYLDEAKVGCGERIPWPDGHFDVVFAHNVLEHLADPSTVFCEVLRVLKPGGVFLVKTPNRFHYVTLLAQLTPVSFHKFFNRLRGRDEEHTFRTHYSANSRTAVARLANRCGFQVKDLLLIEGRPEYLRFSAASYYFGLAWERLVNRFDFFSSMRVLIVAVLQKPPLT